MPHHKFLVALGSVLRPLLGLWLLQHASPVAEAVIVREIFHVRQIRFCRLPLKYRRMKRDHMMSLVTRLLVVAAVTVSISVATVLLLIEKFGAMWNVVPVMVFVINVPATLAMIINYLYWRPRHRAT
jgi:hypothetical protein